MNTTEVILHAEGFAARDDLTSLAEHKAVRLLLRSKGIDRLRLRVVREVPHGGAAHFLVTARLERTGADAIVHTIAAEPDPAVNEAIEKLERIVTSQVLTRICERRQPQAPELPAILPKTSDL